MMLGQQVDAGIEPQRRAAPRRGVALWPLLALLALPIGLLAGWRLAGSAPAEGSPEVTFARDMTAHHDQAVEMATLIRDRTEDEGLRAFALDIILTQQAQAGMMQGWLGIWGRPLVSGAPMGGHGESMGMATQDDVAQLRTLPLDQAEQHFLRLMIRHHVGGVTMARAALQDARHPEVRRLAESIVQGQQGEIDYMQELLARRGAAPEPVEATPGQHGAHP
jgi:uncharacterized protein (DUF305 family)